MAPDAVWRVAELSTLARTRAGRRAVALQVLHWGRAEPTPLRQSYRSEKMMSIQTARETLRAEGAR